MANYYVFQGDTTESEQQLDFFSAPLSMPAGKLDADEYSAEDMDGVTETVFGLGNVSFLSLQSGQSNDDMSLNAIFSGEPDAINISNVSFTNGFIPPLNYAGSNGSTLGALGSDYKTDTDNSISNNSPENIGTVTSEGNFSNTTVASLSTSSFSSSSTAFAPSSYISMSGDVTSNVNIGGFRSFTGDVINQGDTIISNITHGNVTEVVNTVVNNVTEVGGAVTNILQDLGVTNIVNLGDVVNNVVNNEIVSSVTNVVNTVLGDTITNITNNVTDILTGDGHIAINLDADVLETVGAHVGVLVEDSISGDASVNAVTEHLNDVVQDLTGLDIPFIADLGASIGFDLLNGGEGIDNAAGDSDLAINGLDDLGLSLPDIALDPIEGLVGDIDIALDLPTQLLDPVALVEGVQDVVESLGDLDLASVPEVLEILSPEGLDGALGIEFFDYVLGQDLNLNVGDVLSEVQNIVSDVAANLSPELIDNLDGVLDTSLVEGALGDLGVSDVVADIVALPSNLVDLGAPTELMDDVADTVQGGVDLVAGIVEVVDVADISQPIESTVTDITENAGAVVSDIVEDIAELPSDLVDLSEPNELVDDIADTVQGSVDVVAEIVEAVDTNDIFQPIETTVSDVVEDVATITQDSVELVGDTLTEIAAADVSEPVQNIVDDVVGQIDPALNDALDMLGGVAGEVADLGGLANSLGDTWTESGVGNGGLFDDIVSNNHQADSLPDPVSAISEGLGALDIPHLSHHAGGGLGALFG